MTPATKSTESNNTAAAAGLSDYELQRIENIKRNNARLRALGLISEQEEAVSNAVAEGQSPPQQQHENQSTNPRKKKSPSSSLNTEPGRKSRRLQGLTPEGAHHETMAETENETTTTKEESRMERVRVCREQRQRIALRYSQMSDAEKIAAKENPTATYEHCLHRVQTMTEKGLMNRVKAIERASEKHCVVKMAIFKSCLQDEGMWDLAEVAEAALERLKALQPPPQE